MHRYEKGRVLGRGTHGTVLQAKDLQSGGVVAIKKISLGMAKEGINMTALREVKILRELKDAHIVNLLDVFIHKNNLALVFEYMESDLEMVIKNRATVLSPADVKAYMRMLLQALQACHGHWIAHRDVKPNNFLIAASGQMKLADFGLARAFGSPGRGFTNQVFARWYRAPELLFGSALYGPAVDAWAAGCCFAELILRRPWLPGNTDFEQLTLIFQNLGTPTEEEWPDAHKLPQFMEFKEVPPPGLKTVIPKAGDDALDLLGGLVALDPRKRLTISQALQHRYFKNLPIPTPVASLPKPISAHNPLQSQSPQVAPKDLWNIKDPQKAIKRKLDLS